MKGLKIQDFIIAIDVLAGIVLFARLRPRYMRWTVCLLVVTLFVEISMPLHLFGLNKINSLVYTVFTPTECVLYGLVFYYAFEPANKRKFVLVAILLVAVCSVLNYLFLQKEKFNSYTFVLSCVGLTLIAFNYLSQLYSPLLIYRFYHYPLFWVAIGMLLFYPASIFSTGFIQDISIYNKKLGIRLYGINEVLNVLLYSSFLIALLMASSKRFNVTAGNG